MTTLVASSTSPVTALSPPLADGSGTLFVEPWADPLVDRLGHDPRSLYVERYWLPVLGPSTTFMLRRFASYLDEPGEGVEVSVEELAKGLGIGERSGPNAPLARTIKRCVDFQMAEWRRGRLAVRRRVPPLARRHLRRLPESLQVEHEREIEAALAAPPLNERLRSQGRELALCLVGHGDDRAMAEQQLSRWGFEPALASECADWAALELRKARSRRE
jgi:hypothetical protein